MFKRNIQSMLVLFSIICIVSCGGGKWVVKKEGNVEIKKWVEKDKTQYMIKYTYEKGKKIKGEYFKGEEAAPFAVRNVKYNTKGLPEIVEHKGKVDLKVKVVDDKYEIKYSYSNKGYLKAIKQKNKSAYTIASNITPFTKTKFKYDKQGRVKKVNKFVGAGVEVTEYSYSGSDNNMIKTVYKKVGYSTIAKKIMVTEIITVEYKGVPWNGKEKYIDGVTDYISKISNVSIYDNEKKVEKFNLEVKLSAAVEIGKLVKNELKGPEWRIGDLPDPPVPFSEKPVCWY